MNVLNLLFLSLVSLQSIAQEAVPEVNAGVREKFEKVFASPFVIGKGIGGVELGIPLIKMIEILGETDSVSRRKGYDQYVYGPLDDLTVRVSPSGPKGRVSWVRIERTYKGTASNGLRMGDGFAKVTEKMKPQKPYVEDVSRGLILYSSGSQFGMGGDGLGLLRSISAFNSKLYPVQKWPKGAQ